MRDRIFGYETEYGVMIFPGRGGSEAPKRLMIYDFLEYLIGARQKVLQALYRKKGIFMENGGLLNYEALQENFFEGLVETATPECRSAREVALYHAAQTGMLYEVMGELNGRLGELDPRFAGSVKLGKSNVDAEGKYFASHENYQVDDDPGPLSTAALYLLVPFFWLSHILITVISYVPFVLIMLLLIPLALLTGFIGAMLQAVERFRSTGEKMLEFVRDRILGEEFLVNYVALPQGELSKYLYLPWIFLATCLILPHVFKRHKQDLIPFLVTRTPLCGTGKVKLPLVTGAPAEGSEILHSIFEISQRAGAIKSLCRIFFDDASRPVIDVREFIINPLSMLKRKKRLHILFSDTNMSAIGVYLKMGITALILEMIEEGESFEEFRLADALAALHTISADLSLKAPLSLAMGGQATALEIQKGYLARAQAYFAVKHPEDQDAQDLLEKWSYVLGCLEVTPQLLYRKIDWVTKKDLIEEVLRSRASMADIAEVAPWISYLMSRCRISVPHENCPLQYFMGLIDREAAARFERFLIDRKLSFEEFLGRWRLYYEILKVDFKFHQLDDEGYYYQLRHSDLVDELFSDEDIEEARYKPPEATRARVRGELVRRFGSESNEYTFESYRLSSMQSRVRVGWDSFCLKWPFERVKIEDPCSADFAPLESWLHSKGKAGTDEYTDFLK